MSDAALRRGIQESLNQYEYDILYYSQLEEALRASTAQEITDSANESTEEQLKSSSTLQTQQESPPLAGQTEEGFRYRRDHFYVVEPIYHCCHHSNLLRHVQYAPKRLQDHFVFLKIDAVIWYAWIV